VATETVERPRDDLAVRPGGLRLPRVRGWEAVVAVVGGLVLWQLAVEIFEPNPLTVVGPIEVVESGRSLAEQGLLWNDVSVSVEQFFIGFAYALVLGVTVGVLLGASPRASRFLSPWLMILYTVPVIALAPLIIIWFGIGDTAKVVIVATSAFFPIAINTKVGVAGTDRALIDLTTVFGATRVERLRTVLVPNAVPYILAGVRLGIGRGLVGLVFGDLFGATAGLGYLILRSQQNLQTANVFVGVVVIGLLGLLLGGGVSLLERRWARYRPSIQGART